MNLARGGGGFNECTSFGLKTRLCPIFFHFLFFLIKNYNNKYLTCDMWHVTHDI